VYSTQLCRKQAKGLLYKR